MAISLTTPEPTAAEMRRILRTYPNESAASAQLEAFWLELNRFLFRKAEEEAPFADAVFLFEDGETPEGGAEWIESQRWLTRTEAVAQPLP